MSDKPSKAERDLELLRNAQEKGGIRLLGTYFRLSGPGWIASAITLGGGSLASSLYLGVVGGYSLMWLQPFAMILGIIMLGAIGYVTLSTGERPFSAINNHVNPVLGWSWALAVAAANIVWCMPQFSLANGVLTQNLLPELLADDGTLVQWACARMGTDMEGARQTLAEVGPNVWAFTGLYANKLAIALSILVVCTLITWSYDRGGWGLRIYELVLKIVVAMIVLCFIGVVIQLSRSDRPLEWGRIWKGLIPDFGQMFRPADTFEPLLAALGDEAGKIREYWTDLLVTQQRNVMIAAAATAVGINMTFMFPYTMLRKGWTKEFRGLAIFDLSTGMFIPYIVATGCVVIAAASQFHTKLAEGFEIKEIDGQEVLVEPDMSQERLDTLASADRNRQKSVYSKYEGMIKKRNGKFKELLAELKERKRSLEEDSTQFKNEERTVEEELALLTERIATLEEPSDAEKRLAAMLIKRDAMNLAKSLSPLTGPTVANYVFGLGVLAMVMSTISILMLISGFVFTEVLALPGRGWWFRFGTLLAGFGGVLGPFIWGSENAQFYLAIPTSVFGYILLPFAYVTFLLVMNSKSLLGGERPSGAKRFVWNLLMFVAAGVSSAGALIMMWEKAKFVGIASVVVFVVLAMMVSINRYNTNRQPQTEKQE